MNWKIGRVNPYIQNLKRIEFLITFACSGRCKHCSQGDHMSTEGHIDGDAAASVLGKVVCSYNINSLMTFGGEPLLYPGEVCKIHMAARDLGIAERQLITNGFFSRDEDTIKHVAKSIANSGVNNVLLSVDAFHQETIPLECVLIFAKAIQAFEIPKFRIHPAWLTGKDADNPYNNKTREILGVFNSMGIPTSDGNVVHPSGNALRYLSEYFGLTISHISPYSEDPRDIKAICITPNGDVCGGNIYKTGILEILDSYVPKARNEQ